MATKEALRKSAVAALQTWPKDPLRPTAQLRDVLTARYNKSNLSFTSSAEEQQVQAITALLSNKYKKSNPIDQNSVRLPGSGGLLKPRSNPDYYRTLLKDLDEVPTRTAGQSWLIRLKGLFRFG